MLLSKPLREDGRVLREARALLATGYRVTVVQWDRHEPRAPRRERVDGIVLVRVKSMLRRPAMLAIPAWWRAAGIAGHRVHVADPVNVVHAHDLDTLPAGVRLSKALRVPLVFDAHELYPRMVGYALGRAAGELASRLERRLVRQVQLLVTVSSDMQAHYQGLVRAAVPVVVVANWPDLGPKPPPWPSGPFTVAYAGLLDRYRFLPQAIGALADLPGTRLVLAGRREGRYDEVEAASRGAPHVQFLGTLPPDRIVPLYASAHAVLCLLDPAHPHFKLAPATKLFEAMAAGRPVIGTKDSTTGEFAIEHGIGIAVPFSADGLRQGIAALLADPGAAQAMGARGRALAEARFAWPVQAARLVAAYDRLVGSGAPLA